VKSVHPRLQPRVPIDILTDLMLKSYVGNCHCGAIRFEVNVDISAGTGKCNCSICAKSRLWTVEARLDAFRLIAGAEDMADYRGSNPVAHHFFCIHCGVRPFQRVDLPNLSGSPYYNINVACLEGISIEELVNAQVTFYDGRNDNWDSRPLETRHL
jgi:hypothetical protein